METSGERRLAIEPTDTDREPEPERSVVLSDAQCEHVARLLSLVER